MLSVMAVASCVVAEAMLRHQNIVCSSELYAAAEKEERRQEGERGEEEEEELLIELRGKKQAVLEESLEKLQSGIGEATVSHALGGEITYMQ